MSERDRWPTWAQNCQKNKKEVITSKSGGHILHRIHHGHLGYAFFEEMADDHTAFHGWTCMDRDHNRDEAVLDESRNHRQHSGLAADRSHPLADREREGETDRTYPYRNNPSQVASAGDNHHGEGYNCEVRDDRCSNTHRGLEDSHDVEGEATEICIGREVAPPGSKSSALYKKITKRPSNLHLLCNELIAP